MNSIPNLASVRNANGQDIARIRRPWRGQRVDQVGAMGAVVGTSRIGFSPPASRYNTEQGAQFAHQCVEPAAGHSRGGRSGRTAKANLTANPRRLRIDRGPWCPLGAIGRSGKRSRQR